MSKYKKKISFILNIHRKRRIKIKSRSKFTLQSFIGEFQKWNSTLLSFYASYVTHYVKTLLYHVYNSIFSKKKISFINYWQFQKIKSIRLQQFFHWKKHLCNLLESGLLLGLVFFCSSFRKIVEFYSEQWKLFHCSRFHLNACRFLRIA